MSRYSKLWLALLVGFVGTGGCGLSGGEDSSSDEKVISAAQALESNGISANLVISDDWTSGYVARISVKNTGATATSNWQVDVQLNNSNLDVTTTPWGATYSQTGTVVTFSGTTTLQPNGTTEIGFKGASVSTANNRPSVVAVRRSSAGTGGNAGTGGTSSTSSTAGAGGTGGSTRTTTTSTPPTSGGTGGTSTGNIAISKPTTSSGDLTGNPASYGNDTASNTDWCSSGTAAYVYWQVDLGATYDVSQTRITWPVAASFGYTIQTSLDGTSFVTALDKQTNASSNQTETDAFTARTRYLRLFVTSRPASVSRICLRDFQAFGTIAPSQGTGGQGSTSGGAANTSTTAAGSSAGSSSGTTASGGTVNNSGGTASTGGFTSAGTGSTAGTGTTGTPIEFTFKLPRDVDRSEIALGTTAGQLFVNDHTKVLGPKGVGTFASVSAVAGGVISRIGYYTEVQNAWSDQDIHLANLAIVHGDAFCTGAIDAQEGAEVLGKRYPLSNIGPFEVVSWTVNFPPYSDQVISLQPNDGATSKDPGAYAGFIVNRSTSLKLKTGTYYFDKLAIESGGGLDIDNSAGPVYVYVRNSLTLRGAITRSVDKANFLLGYAGTETVPIDTPFYGILVAPNAEVILATQTSPHKASFFAKKFTAHQFNRIVHEPWERDTLCEATAECSSFCPCGTDDGALCNESSDCKSGLDCTSSGHCVCTPKCTGKTCGGDLSDGCGGRCVAVCETGTIGCTQGSDCEAGNTCWEGKGAQFGFPAGTNVCAPAICIEQDPREANCGVGTANCGSCPVCKPDCTGKQCGSNGCGGSCGSTSAGQVCLAGTVVDLLDPSQSHSADFPTPIPTDFSPLEYFEAGTIPGSFRVTEQGTANYTIPLALPPGRNGLVPNLNLTYESTRSAGSMGVGWALGGFSKIERCNRTKAVHGAAGPIDLSTNDAFCMDGKVLVSATGAAGQGLKTAATLDTELEEFKAIQQIGFNSAHGPRAFKVWTKDGHILTYGEVNDYNSQALGSAATRNDAVVQARYYGGLTGRSWHLSQIEDQSGDYVSFYYTQTTDDRGVTTEIVPDYVVYGGKQDPFSPGSHPYWNGNSVVQYSYVDHPKPTYHYIAGQLAYQTKLLTQIDVYNALSSTGGRATTSYKLSYETPEVYGPQLSTITLCSRGVTGTSGNERCLPPTKIEYEQYYGYASLDDNRVYSWPKPPASAGDCSEGCSRCREGYGSYVPPLVLDANGDGDDEVLIDNEAIADVSTDQDTHELNVNFSTPIKKLYGSQVALDVNGDNCDDIVATSGVAAKIYINENKGINFKEVPLYGDKKPLGPLATYSIYHTGDVDGDGRKDLIIIYSNASRNPPSSLVTYMRFSGTQLEDEKVLIRRPTADIPLLFNRLLVNDYNGDGVVDIYVIRKDNYTIVRADSLDRLPDVTSLVEAEVTLDANGDGLPDVLTYGGRTGTPEYDQLVLLLNSGYGWMVPQIINIPKLATSHPPGGAALHRIAHVFDYNHDGLQDVFIPPYSNEGNFPGVVLQGENGTLKTVAKSNFSAWNILGGDVGIADLNGDGVSDTFSLDIDELKDCSANRTFRAGISKDRAPGLVSKITNGLGERVSISYNPTSRSPSLSGDDTTPPRSAVPVYTRTAPTDEVQTRTLKRVSPLVSQYSTNQINPNNGAVMSPTETHSFQYYDGKIGVDGRGWYGFSKIVETLDAGSASITSTETLYHNDAYWRAGLVAQVTTSSNRIADGPNHSAYYQTVVTNNTWAKLSSGLSGRTYPWLSSQTVIEFENGTTGMVSRTQRDMVPDGYGNVSYLFLTRMAGSTVRERTTLSYNFTPDTGRWIINKPTAIDTTKTRNGETESRKVQYTYYSDGLLQDAIREPDLPEFKLTTHFERDPESRNVITITESTDTGTSRTSQILYDRKSFFPVAYQNPLGEVTEVQFDDRTGQLLTEKDPNGVTTQFGYDPFGRFVVQKTPKETVTRDYVAEFRARSTAAGGEVWSATVTNDITFPTGARSRNRYDGKGRLVFSQTYGYNGTPVLEEFERDWAGRVVRQTLPHTTGSTSQGAMRYTYDILGRLTSSTAPDGLITTYEQFSIANSMAEPDFFAGDAIRALAVSSPNGAFEYRLLDDRNLPVETIKAGLALDTPVRGGVNAGINPASRYQYSPFGVPTSITDADGEVTTLEHDVLGRRRRIEADSTGTTTTNYNAFGEVTDETDANGEKTCFSYDSLSRPLTQTRADGSGNCNPLQRLTAVWQYGNSTGEFGKLVYGYRESAVGSGTGTQTRYRYEVPIPGVPYAGRLSSVEQTVPGYDETLVTGYEYADQYLAKVNYPAVAGQSFAVHYARDEYGHVINVSDASGGDDDGFKYWEVADFEEGHRVTMERTVNGKIQTAYGYSAIEASTGHCTRSGSGSCMPGDLRSLRTSPVDDPGNAIHQLDYDYDAGGYVSRVAQLINSQPAVTDHYNNDVFGQLRNHTRTQGKTEVVSSISDYSYSLGGDLEQVVDGKTYATDTYRYTPAQQHLVRSAANGTYDYDLKGRQILRQGTGVEGESQAIVYNDLNLPERSHPEER